MSRSGSVRHGLAVQLTGLRRHAARLCQNHAEADDLVQETVLRALRFEHTFVQGSNLRAWLHQILVSVFISQCRSKKRARLALYDLSVDPCAWPERECSLVPDELSPRVQQALQDLPVHFQQVVELVDVKQCEYKQAAALVGVPVGTVMSRLFRGRKLLAGALAESEPVSRVAA